MFIEARSQLCRPTSTDSTDPCHTDLNITFLSRRHVASRSLSTRRCEQWYGCHLIWLQMHEVLWEQDEQGSSQRPVKKILYGS